MIRDNRSCGVVIDGCAGADITGNSIRDNGSTGVLVKDDSSDCDISRNVFANNRPGKRRQLGKDDSSGAASRGHARDIVVQDAAANVRVGPNRFL
jgi:parallel beta-helix repeat protein